MESLIVLFELWWISLFWQFGTGEAEAAARTCAGPRISTDGSQGKGDERPSFHWRSATLVRGGSGDSGSRDDIPMSAGEDDDAELPPTSGGTNKDSSSFEISNRTNGAPRTKRRPHRFMNDPPTSSPVVQHHFDQWSSYSVVKPWTRRRKSSKDDQGERKQVAASSGVLVLLLVMFRSFYLHVLVIAEVLNMGKYQHTLLAFPLLALISANVAGVAAVVRGPPSLPPTKRLKAVSTVEIAVNVLWIAYSFLRLAIYPTPFPTRQTHIWNVLVAVSCLWLGNFSTLWH
jgi:hypothetical protein